MPSTECVKCVFARCFRRPDRREGNRPKCHRFPPLSEKAVRDKWVNWVKETCGLTTFVLNNSSRLCYRHFTSEAYRPNGRWLLRDSCPTITPEDIDKDEDSPWDSSESCCSSENDSAHKSTDTKIACWQAADSTGSTEVFSEAEMGSSSGPTMDTESQTVSSTNEPAGSLDQVPSTSTRRMKRKSLARTSSPSDFSTPSKAAQNFIVMKGALKKSRYQICRLQSRMRIAAKKVNKMQFLLEHLKKKKMISAEGFSEAHVISNCVLSALCRNLSR